MDRPRITLLGIQETQLKQYFQSDPHSHERAAVVLFRRLCSAMDGIPNADRYLAVDVITFDDSWVSSSSSSHIAFLLAPLRDIFRRCEEENLVFGFVHNHPTDFPTFSEVDDKNELTLLSALTNRNGKNISFVSLLWANKSWQGRVRNGAYPEVAFPVRHIAVVSDCLHLHGYDKESGGDDALQARQAAAFGRPFVNILRSLRIGVVGGGGTGSAIATLLARAGVGEIIVIDKDHLEKSNLNRVRGSTKNDVGKNKAKILEEYIKSLEISVAITSIPVLIDESPDAIDALSTCDIVLGCTDDQIGRDILNSSLYYFSQCLIDLGLGGSIQIDEHGVPILRRHHARISTILPEFGECLFCQGVITQEKIQFEYAQRNNPDITESEAKEHYLDGSREEAPGVAPFTGAAADFAVAGLFDLVRPFRRLPANVRKDFYKIDFVNMEITSQAEQNNSSCPYCQGENFLLKNDKYRLGRPALGKRNEHF